MFLSYWTFGTSRKIQFCENSSEFQTEGYVISTLQIRFRLHKYHFKHGYSIVCYCVNSVLGVNSYIKTALTNWGLGMRKETEQ